MNIVEKLKQRNYVEQMTNEEGLKDLLDKEKVTFYLGIDPTADSLHIGHFSMLMIASLLQKEGHKPIILMGGATGTIGDPSGKEEMRKLLTIEDIENNVNSIKKQVERFLSFEGDNGAEIVNNADWTSNRGYIEFLRDIGIHFNVNKMLSAEAYKARLKNGLTFFELGYMLMQANDFKHLYETKNCKLQIGGNDQWSNLIAGVDLVRKTHKEEVYTLSGALLTNKDGKKMGKTVSGALWLDSQKLTPYEFFQYFRNIGDEEIEKIFLALTYVPYDEVKELMNSGNNPNNLKERLAFEVTKIIHGEEEASKALETSKALFAGSEGSIDALPEVKVSIGDRIIEIAKKAGFGTSNGQIKQFIKDGAIMLNDTKVEVQDVLEEKDIKNDGNSRGHAILTKGKKQKVKIIIK